MGSVFVTWTRYRTSLLPRKAVERLPSWTPSHSTASAFTAAEPRGLNDRKPRLRSSARELSLRSRALPGPPHGRGFEPRGGRQFRERSPALSHWASAGGPARAPARAGVAHMCGRPAHAHCARRMSRGGAGPSDILGRPAPSGERRCRRRRAPGREQPDSLRASRLARPGAGCRPRLPRAAQSIPPPLCVCLNSAQRQDGNAGGGKPSRWVALLPVRPACPGRTARPRPPQARSAWERGAEGGSAARAAGEAELLGESLTSIGSILVYGHGELGVDNAGCGCVCQKVQL